MEYHTAMQFLFSEARTKSIEAICEVIKTTGLILGGGWILFQYISDHHEKARLSEIEAHAPFYSMQLDVYRKLTYAAATIAKHPDATQRTTAGIEFAQLTSGPLTLVSEVNVDNAIAEFYKCKAQGSSCKNLEHYARNISRECRKSLTHTWKTQSLGYARQPFPGEAPESEEKD